MKIITTSVPEPIPPTNPVVISTPLLVVDELDVYA